MTLASDFNRIDCSETAPCEGDINGDGAVNADDLTLFAAEFGRTDCPLDEFYYFHNDHLGTPQRITDQTGTIVWSANYMPFGEAIITTNTITNPFRFPGQYYDQETGLHYNYFRYYDTGIGRYLRPDPIELAINQLTIRQLLLKNNTRLNRSWNYVYVNSDPVNFTDFCGLYSKRCKPDCPGGEWSAFSPFAVSAFYGGGFTIQRSTFKCKTNNIVCEATSLCFGGGAIAVAGLGIDFGGYPKWTVGITNVFHKAGFRKFSSGIYVAGGMVSGTLTGTTKTVGVSKSWGGGIAYVTCICFNINCNF